MLKCAVLEPGVSSVLGMPLQVRQRHESARGNVQRVGREETGMNMFVLRGRSPAGFQIVPHFRVWLLELESVFLGSFLEVVS